MMKNQIKQLLCLLMALVMVFSMAACGGSDDKKTTKDPASSTDAPDVTDTTQEATEPIVGTTISTALWDLTYDEADGWVYDAEEDLTDRSDYCKITIRVPNPENEEKNLIRVYLLVNLDKPYSFRDDLVRYGFDEYEYGANHAYEMTNVGGVDCVSVESESWGSTTLRYMGRDEAAGATVTVDISGDSADSRVEKLLSGLSIHLTDVGNEDGPWYWEGEPFSTENHQVMVGTNTLSSTWIPFQENVRTYEVFEHAVAVYGEVAYVLIDGTLKQYAFDGATLSYPVDIALNDEYERLNLDQSGNLWLSDFGSPLIRMTDGQMTASYKDPDYVAMDPTGTWGISWFSKPECKKLVLTDGIMSVETITFAELKMVNDIFIDENHIYVCGNAADESGHKIFIYDHAGTYQLTLEDDDGSGLGSMTFVAETANGFLGLDGNMREVVLWSKDGTYIGDVDDSDLFGTHYPWFCGACKLDDGSFLVIMTEDRADKSAMELIAFKLSGF